MSNLKQLAGQTAIYGLSSIVGRLLNYLLVPLYTRLLLPEEYGVVTEFYAYLTFLVVLYSYGMETTFFRFSQNADDSNKAYHTGLFSLLSSSLFFSLLLILFSGTIADWLDYPGQEIYIYLFSSVLLCDTLSALPFAQLRKKNKAIQFASYRLINILINIGLNLFFLLLLPKWENQEGISGSIASALYSKNHEVLYIFLSNAIASAVTLVLFAKHLIIKRSFIDTALLKNMLRYAMPLLIAGMAGMINETLDRVILKPLVDDPESANHQLGIYGACYKLSIIMTLFIQTYRFAAEPFFLSKNKEQSREMLALVLKYFTIICSLIFLVVMFYMDYVKHFIGENYWEGLHIVPILLIANIFLGIFFNLSMWYKLSSQTYYGAYFALAGACITIISNIILIPKLGYTGAAWATLICYVSITFLSYYHGQKQYHIPYETKKILAYLSMAILLYVFMENVIMPLSDKSSSTKILAGTFLIVAYAVWAWLRERPQKKLFL
ncbi:MAG TPA: polysaccharide biosynthesis C-terminal domain-containing protein [Bacteroidia bacterium]|nr:polysaccharide biosynthesis C-terminal domain-containing protein [Bacteroidia bacterium]HNT79518.1 polysaccharide biosynthesis C-terminal domain-containing protein [Bacteroidia bacterium]